MAKKRRASAFSVSPLHPSVHFILFLVLAFVLVVVVGYVMQQTAKATRARLLCPQVATDQVRLVEELSHRCPTGVVYATDQNGCGVWVCKTPVASPKSPPTRSRR